MTLKELDTCDWVYVLCSDCGGFRSGCADIRGNKKLIKDDIFWASKDGKEVRWVHHDEPRPPACLCGLEDFKL